jgi:hypothetical protein
VTPPLHEGSLSRQVSVYSGLSLARRRYTSMLYTHPLLLIRGSRVSGSASGGQRTSRACPSQGYITAQTCCLIAQHSLSE